MTHAKDKQTLLPGLGPDFEGAINMAREKRAEEIAKVKAKSYVCPFCRHKGAERSVTWDEQEQCCICSTCGRVDIKRTKKMREAIA